MTNVQPITNQDARDYVAAYFKRHNQEVDITQAVPSPEGEGAIDVLFMESGNYCRFTVWRGPDGSIYGEW